MEVLIEILFYLGCNISNRPIAAMFLAFPAGESHSGVVFSDTTATITPKRTRRNDFTLESYIIIRDYLQQPYTFDNHVTIYFLFNRRNSSFVITVYNWCRTYFLYLLRNFQSSLRAQKIPGEATGRPGFVDKGGRE